MPPQEGIIQETQWRKDTYLSISHHFWLSQGVDKIISTYARAVLIAALTHGGCLLSTAVLQHRIQSWKCSILSGPDAPIPSPSRLPVCSLGKPWGKGAQGACYIAFEAEDLLQNECTTTDLPEQIMHKQRQFQFYTEFKKTQWNKQTQVILIFT